VAANNGFFFLFFPLRNTDEEKEKKKKKKTIKAMLATRHQHALPWKGDLVITILVLFRGLF
jgi:hypothetical protein